MGRRSGNYPPELRERAVRMVAEVRPEYPLGLAGDLCRGREARHRDGRDAAFARPRWTPGRGLV